MPTCSQQQACEGPFRARRGRVELAAEPIQFGPVHIAPGPNTTDGAHFTLGSHVDDMLRVQGTPTSITRRDSIDKMIWRYGISRVEISTRTNRVLEYSNQGNLRVHIAPGPNTTDGTHFTLGSHVDDVLRVQGTPTSITRQDSIGKMILAVRHQPGGDFNVNRQGCGLVEPGEPPGR